MKEKKQGNPICGLGFNAAGNLASKLNLDSIPPIPQLKIEGWAYLSDIERHLGGDATDRLVKSMLDERPHVPFVDVFTDPRSPGPATNDCGQDHPPATQGVASDCGKEISFVGGLRHRLDQAISNLSSRLSELEDLRDAFKTGQEVNVAVAVDILHEQKLI